MGPDNPVLAELDGLSPQAKNALTLAHTRVVGGGGPSLLAAANGPAAGRAPTPALGNAAPNVPAPAPTPAPIAQPALPAAPGFRQPGAHPFQTSLAPTDEQQFQSWVKTNHVPFDPGPQSDYDMRGYWNANRGNGSGTEMRSDGLHFPDTYKTPFHRSASNESIYMPSDAPHWNQDQTQLVANDGKVVFNEPSTAGAPALRAIATPGVNKVAPLGPPSNLARDKGELDRLTAPAVPGEHDKQQTGLSGIAQIHNPWARIPLQIADALGGAFFPGVMRNIPGSQIHHNELVRESERNVQGDEALESEQAKNALEGIQGTEAQARAGEADARTEALKNPQDEFTPVSTTGGYDVFSKKHGTATPLLVNGEQAQPIEKQLPANVHVLPDGTVLSVNKDPKTGKITPEVLYQGDPKVKTEVTKLEVGGKPHSVIVNSATGATIKDLGETGEKPPTVNVNASNARDFQLNERGRGLLDKAESAYRSAAQSADDLIGMIDMAKAGNKVAAQASPLEGTLAIVTSQGVKRINRTEVESIQGAGSLFDQLMGKVGKLKEGQPIPPDIQNDFQKLAGMLKKNAYSSYRDAFASAKKRYKLDDEEPLAEPDGANPGTPAHGIPDIGSTFNGGKVLKVTRVD